MLKKRALTILMILGMSVSLLVGCNSASADETGEITKIRIAQIPDENNPEVGVKNEAFTKAFEEYIGIEIEEHVITEYGVGIEAMRSGNLELMLVSPMSYYQATQRLDVDPVASTGSFGGVPYKSVFITRSDRDDINTLEDLEGKNFAFVDPGSSSGYVFPKVTLVKELGIDPDQLENPDYFFDTVTYSGQHDASLMGVIMGDYDAAVVTYAMLPMLEEAGIIDLDDVKIIGETPEIPNPLYIMRSDLPEEIKDSIVEFYLQYNDEEYFEALYGDSEIRFIEAEESDYEIIFDMVELLGIKEEE